MANKTSGVRTIKYAFHCNAGDYGILLAKSALTRNFSLHTHDFYEFEIVVRGEVLHTISAQGEHLTRGDFHCLAPDTLHSVEAASTDGLIYNISVYLPDAPPSVRDALAAFAFPCRGKLPEEVLLRLEGLYDLLFSDARAHVPHEKEKVSALAVYILTALSEHAVFFGGNVTAAHIMPHVQRAMAIVRERYAEDLRLCDVAAVLGLSEGYLSSIFASELGVGFKEYLRTVRIRHAMQMLATTDESVTAIALASGFGSFSNFERSFSRACGVTPREYRRHAQGK